MYSTVSWTVVGEPVEHSEFPRGTDPEAPTMPLRIAAGIALICALALEAECVQEVFDKFWEDEGKTTLSGSLISD